MYACLGTANYYTTIPFLLVLGAVGLLMLVRPGQFRRAGEQAEGWSARLVPLVIVAFASWGIPSAVREARERPDCEPVSTSLHTSGRPGSHQTDGTG